MKAIMVNGSPRSMGNTFAMLNTVADELKAAGFEVGFSQVGGKAIRGCAACRKCGENRDMKCVIKDELSPVIEQVLSADIIVLGSPTYFADITSELKALIDRAGVVARANGHVLSRKIGAAVVAGRRGGKIHAFNSINHFFLISGMLVPGSTYWNVSCSGAIGDYEKDQEGVSTVKTLGENIVWLANKIS